MEPTLYIRVVSTSALQDLDAQLNDICTSVGLGFDRKLVRDFAAQVIVEQLQWLKIRKQIRPTSGPLSDELANLGVYLDVVPRRWPDPESRPPYLTRMLDGARLGIFKGVTISQAAVLGYVGVIHELAGYGVEIKSVLLEQILHREREGLERTDSSDWKRLVAPRQRQRSGTG